MTELYENEISIEYHMVEVLKNKKPAGTCEAQIDLTEYQRSMQALRESEDKYRTLIEKSLDAIAIVKGDKFVFGNDAFLEMFGYESDEEVIGSTITDHVVPQSRAMVRSRGFARENGEEVSSRYEVKARKKDGTIFDAELSVGLITFKGEVARQVIIRDISQQKRMEQALRETEEKFRLFQSSVFDVIYRYDPQNNRYDFISPSVEQQTGYTVEEFSSHPREITQRITHPEDWEKVQAEVKQEIAKGPPGRSLRVEYRVIRKDGREIWVSDQKTLEFSPQGKLCRINGVVRDITERKRAEEALRESEEKYRHIVANSIDGIAMAQEGKIVYVNDAYCKIFGYKKQELIGESILEVVAPEDRPLIEGRAKKRFKGEKVPNRYVFNGMKRDGTRLFIEVSSSKSFIYENKPTILAILRDITERKRTEEKLKEYTRQIEEKNQELIATRAQLVQEEKLRALGQMASGVAHNFNNLLAIVLGRAQLLQRKAKELEIEKGLRSIERAALDASSTVKRIQDFARVRKDQEFKWVNIDELIEDAIVLTKSKWKDQTEANGSAIGLEVRKDRRRLPPVFGDESGLREVFTNILFNAVEAMPKGGRIVICTRTNRKSVSVSFTDFGTGIPDEVKQKIFDPFFTTKGVRNAGLGLSVAYGIVQRHQGDIKIESKPGKGTTVVVRLPASKSLAEKQGKEAKSEKPALQEMSANILVIEDEQDIRELLFDILTSANYMVKLASSGAEGLETCKKEKFDIVFTDLGMPGMSGWEVAQTIKEIDSNTTIFLITGWGVEMDEEKLKESGVDRVVTKPVKVEALLTLVSQTMESKKRGKGLGPKEGIHPEGLSPH